MKFRIILLFSYAHKNVIPWKCFCLFSVNWQTYFFFQEIGKHLEKVLVHDR